jgi:hypothetical protein
MPEKSAFGTSLMLTLSVTLVGWQSAAPSPGLGQEPDLAAEFSQLCDANCKLVEKQARATKREGRAFYWDSYVVRALCAAYDMNGKQEYMSACKLWSDRMLEFQKDMIPEGAYYMQYGRKPGEKEGGWYAADCACIALAVLATAIRCEDPAEKAKYLNSVLSFAELVSENFVRPSGGVTDGYWSKSDKEWWCSTGVFGSLAFHLYQETGDKSYLKIGLDTIDWLNRQDLLTVAVHFPPETIKPTVMLYSLEAYSAGLAHLKPGSERHKLAMAQWGKAFDWMSKNQRGQAGIDYLTQWGSKFGGLPFLMYVYANHVPASDELVQAADRELRYMAGILAKAPASNHRDQLALFAMMSYAEKLSPGTIYRSSRRRSSPR